MKALGIVIPLIIIGGLVMWGRAAAARVFDPWSYDTDKDGKINMSEMLKAVNDYNMGLITEAQRDAVVSLWKLGIIR